MMCRTFRMSTANCMTDKQFRSVCTTRLATFRWTNNSPGARPTIWFAGTRLSEQPIQRYFGACCWASSRKNSGFTCRMPSDQARLFSKRWSIVSMRGRPQPRHSPPNANRVIEARRPALHQLRMPGDEKHDDEHDETGADQNLHEAKTP